MAIKQIYIHTRVYIRQVDKERVKNDVITRDLTSRYVLTVFVDEHEKKTRIYVKKFYLLNC